MLRVNDIIYSINKATGKIKELRVVRTTDRHAHLSNGKKITANDVDSNMYWEIPKSVNQLYTYLEPNDDIIAKFEAQNSSATFWDRLSSFDAQVFFSSPKVVLLFAVALLLGQSFHSFHALFDLAGNMNPIANVLFSALTAVFLDGILLFHISIGNRWYSWAAFLTCFLLNTYSYHLGQDYWTYRSWFSFVPAFAMPYFLHSVGVTLKHLKREH